MKKLGHIFCPTGEWTHASTPTACFLGADTWRVFYASRDSKNRGHIFALDIDMRNPLKPFNNHGPLISPGEKGTFDDCGLSPSCIDGNRLYYLGWNLRNDPPFMNTIGSCLLNGGRIERDRQAPDLDRCEVDPISLAYPYVINNVMFYSSNAFWRHDREDFRFSLKFAKRGDGWSRDGSIALRPGPRETAIVRPSVIHDGTWKMWFATKSYGFPKGYRIGYASCEEFPQSWDRKEFGFNQSPELDWDSEEQTYPCVFQHRGETFMLYNGNGYGKTGFGIAVAG